MEDRVAVGGATNRLTYRQLTGAVGQYARSLMRSGVRGGDVVVVEVPRSPEEVIAVLAVLSVGATYVSMDAAAPPPRLGVMAELVKPRAVIGRTDRARQIASLSAAECVVLDPPDPTAFDADSDAPTPVPVGPESAAYIGFTSGSTGAPKAVVVPHRAVIRLMRAADGFVRSDADDTEVWLRLAPLAFDASTFELFCCLFRGAELAVYPDGPVSPKELADFLAARGVTVAWLTAGLFRTVADEAPEAFASLTQLVTGGDVVPADRVRAVLDRAAGSLAVTNGYGPTENTTFSTTFTARSASDWVGSFPIGEPIEGTEVKVLTEDGTDVPAPGAPSTTHGEGSATGEMGELLVGGVGLSLGYLGDPEQTAQRFVVIDGMRFYRTGDLVRWDEDGKALQFCGRIDRQIKIRGHRVELEDVEATVRRQAEVRDCHVRVAPNATTAQLVAYVVAQDQAATDPTILRDSLREQLPAYMQPDQLVLVKQLPLNANGKIDESRLADLAAATSARRLPEASPGDRPADSALRLESQIELVWCEVLGLDAIEYDEAFFDVGGDSLTIGTVHTRLRELYPAHDLKVIDLFTHPTIQELADHLRSRDEG
ncbi:non-ribosomal peptide synthetase [Nocardioides sp. BSK12Z-4]|uniref:Non-ribosomal peptide synthetase n=2 Tax=Nocardioides bruguierae TaxID=2945102 RepID=A0A9X2IH28_9ACTN|nr:non-ribosomal peptide synthetase [Nocardioides bruguierae]